MDSPLFVRLRRTFNKESVWGGRARGAGPPQTLLSGEPRSGELSGRLVHGIAQDGQGVGDTGILMDNGMERPRHGYR